MYIYNIYCIDYKSVIDILECKVVYKIIININKWKLLIYLIKIYWFVFINYSLKDYLHV